MEYDELLYFLSRSSFYLKQVLDGALDKNEKKKSLDAVLEAVKKTGQISEQAWCMFYR